MRLETYRLGRKHQFTAEERPMLVQLANHTVAEVRRETKRDHIPIDLGFAATLLGGTLGECPLTGSRPEIPPLISRKRGFTYHPNASEMGDLGGPTVDCTECGFATDCDSIHVTAAELRRRPHPIGHEAILEPHRQSARLPLEHMGWKIDHFIEDDLAGRLILAFGTLLRPVITEELLRTQFPGCEILTADREYGVAVIPDEPSANDYSDLLGERIQNIHS